MYDPALGRWLVMDRKAELYYGTSAYVYALNQPTNAIDPDGNIVIFVNGFTPNASEQGTSQYWREFNGPRMLKWHSGNAFTRGYRYENTMSRAFDLQVMNRFNDHNAKYYDGSDGGLTGLPINTMAGIRDLHGYAQGQKDAEAIIMNLARDKNGNIIESIKVITHSMGGAYAKGFIRALKEYIRKNEIQGVRISEFDFAPFQPDEQKAEDDVPTRQYSHSDDRVAGNEPMEGASQEDTSGDETQDHSIYSFFNQIKNLPTGNYKVVDGKIVPDN